MQRVLRDAIIEKGLSVRQSEALARRLKAPRPMKGKRSELHEYLQSLADRLKRSLGTKVDIRRRGRQGRIIIHFYSDDELERLLERLE